MIFQGAGKELIIGTPGGRQRVYGKSLDKSAPRCLNNAAAQGWRGTSSGFRSAAMLFRYFGGTSPLPAPAAGSHQIPERSGFPSAARGAGAERFGLPSALRGMLGALTFSHCAKAGAGEREKIPAKAAVKLNLIQFVAFIRLPRMLAAAYCFGAGGS